VLYVVPQLAVERVARHGRHVAEDDQLHACAGDGHIHAAQVAQESYLPLVVRAHQRDDDDVALLPLEPVNRIHRYKAAERLEEVALHEQPPQKLHLCPIGRDDAHVDALVQQPLLANLVEIVLQGQ